MGGGGAGGVKGRRVLVWVSLCVCVCVRACVRACAWVGGRVGGCGCSLLVLLLDFLSLELLAIHVLVSICNVLTLMLNSYFVYRAPSPDFIFAIFSSSSSVNDLFSEYICLQRCICHLKVLFFYIFF